VVAASTKFTRGFLRKAWEDAQAATPAPVTLLAKLQALNSSAVDAVSGGKTLSQTTGHGRSVTFTVHGSEGVTPTDMAEVCSRLLDLYDAAVAAGSATDSDRYAWMMTNLQPVRSLTTSFAGFSRY
jgi:hypothetical protein